MWLDKFLLNCTLYEFIYGSWRQWNENKFKYSEYSNINIHFHVNQVVVERALTVDNDDTTELMLMLVVMMINDDEYSNISI